jgi:hypothetical protein
LSRLLRAAMVGNLTRKNERGCLWFEIQFPSKTTGGALTGGVWQRQLDTRNSNKNILSNTTNIKDHDSVKWPWKSRRFREPLNHFQFDLFQIVSKYKMFAVGIKRVCSQSTSFEIQGSGNAVTGTIAHRLNENRVDGVTFSFEATDRPDQGDNRLRLCKWTHLSGEAHLHGTWVATRLLTCLTLMWTKKWRNAATASVVTLINSAHRRAHRPAISFFSITHRLGDNESKRNFQLACYNVSTPAGPSGGSSRGFCSCQFLFLLFSPFFLPQQKRKIRDWQLKVNQVPGPEVGHLHITFGPLQQQGPFGQLFTMPTHLSMPRRWATALQKNSFAISSFFQSAPALPFLIHLKMAALKV